MKIIHISTECYPAAKAGGLGDVTGALPKYLNRRGHDTSVIIPKYGTTWIENQETVSLFTGQAPYELSGFDFSIRKAVDPGLGFDLYFVDIPERFDRPGIYIDPLSGYAYWDEMDRYFIFQVAVLEWLANTGDRPDIIHCHDHHTALIPFMTTCCFRYQNLKKIPTVLTIHNGEYQGRYDRGNYVKLPAFNLNQLGLLEWDENLNALAAGIKCAWRVTTVSNGYLRELMTFAHGMESLLQHEADKTAGLINGIDMDVWNPSTDKALIKNYTTRTVKSGKTANKTFLCEEFNLNPEWPLFSFIGRLVHEKGADLLPELIQKSIGEGMKLNLLILGTGEPLLHKKLSALRGKYVGYFNTRLEYNEDLAHRIYAGSDFLLMPSRVEPCGLNQMYAMRYGTVPVVRSTGGLADTVVDISQENGFGIGFKNLSIPDTLSGLERALDLYSNKTLFSQNRKKIMELDYSWDKASKAYEQIYQQLN